MWGCTGGRGSTKSSFAVFPTHVGVYLHVLKLQGFNHRFPHTCGGVPVNNKTFGVRYSFSPHMWGCTENLRSPADNHAVFPTHVGVYRGSKRGCFLKIRFPHTCGGVPSWQSITDRLASFSPHMWGCTFPLCRAPSSLPVFPTHVGVYREYEPAAHVRVSFPHTCGGVPCERLFRLRNFQFSPHMWGCTFLDGGNDKPEEVFPTHVGVYRFGGDGGVANRIVFPTHVGVYR